MKVYLMVIVLLIFSLVATPVCHAGVGGGLEAAADLAEGVLWIPAILLVVSVGIPMYIIMKLEEGIQPQEVDHVS